MKGPMIALGGVAGTAAVVGTAATASYEIAARRSQDPEHLADRFVRRATFGVGAAGAVAFAGGMVAAVAGMRSNRALAGAGVLAAMGGFGAFAGGLAASGIYHARHGAPISDIVNGVLDNYDHNDNGRIDLDAQRGHRSELHRVEEDCEDREDSVFDDCKEDVYTIGRLAKQANADGDSIVTRDELVTYVRRFDTQPQGGDRRIKGSELSAFERAAGESWVG